MDKRTSAPAVKSSAKHSIRRSAQNSLALVAPEPSPSQHSNHRPASRSFGEGVDVQSSNDWEEYHVDRRHSSSREKSELLVDFSKYGF